MWKISVSQPNLPDDTPFLKKNDAELLPFFRRDDHHDLEVCRSFALASADYGMKTSCHSNILDFDTGVNKTSTWNRKIEDQSKVWRQTRGASVEMQKLSQKEKNYRLDGIDLEKERELNLDLESLSMPIRNDNGEHRLENRQTTGLCNSDLDTGLKEFTHLILAKKA
uniref:uncharacterized protein isoform X3 n=1 Tax=Myxine glutinosa TaxID=7769 RepID=UPI00358E1A1C